MKPNGLPEKISFSNKNGQKFLGILKSFSPPVNAPQNPTIPPLGGFNTAQSNLQDLVWNSLIGGNMKS